MLVRIWKKGNPHALLVRMHTGAATVENSMEVPHKIKNSVVMQSSNSISGYLSTENKNTSLKRYRYPYSHCRIISSSQDLKQPRHRSTDNGYRRCGTHTTQAQRHILQQ